MASIDVLVTDVGTFRCPSELSVRSLRCRKDGQPDRRYNAGKDWYARFRQFSDARLKEYLET